jgi:GNAT superfamily N-acetyltransferase
VSTRPADPRASIRPIREDEVDELYAMVCELAEYERSLEHVESTAADFRRALFGPDPKLFAHVVEDRLVEDRHRVDHQARLGGFAVWFVNFSTWSGQHGIYLEDLYVRPHLRGQGYGKALLATLAGICVERGYARLEWWVLDWNRPAWEFYDSLGALPMEEWTVHRLTKEPLRRLGSP